MSKSIPEVTTKWTLNEYLSGVLLKHETNDGLREEIKHEIQLTKSQLNEHFIEFNVDLNELNKSYNNLIAFNDEMKALETQLNSFIGSDLMTKINELKAICNQTTDRINRSKHLAVFIENFKQINREMDLIDESFNLNSYEMSVQYMTSASKLYQELIQTIDSNNDLTNISKELKPFLDSIKTELILKREELVFNTKQLFNTNVKTFRDEFNKENIFEFNLIQYLKTNEYKNFIKILVEFEKNYRFLNDLIIDLNRYFIKPILNEEVNQLLLEDNRITAKVSNTNTTSCPPLSLLKQFFDYLNQLITDKNKITIGRQLLRHLGHLWAEDVFNQILKHYLNRLMPKNESEVKSYLSVVNSAEDFRRFLIEVEFIDEKSNSPFIEFALNINSYFCRNLCVDFIISAKSMVSRDLHKTVEVGGDSENQLNPKNPFPLCRISEFMVDLKDLMKHILELCSQCSTECSEALVEAIENICELYIDISPVFHKKMITEFPQQNAIFHNNCMFFAHFIESFAFQYNYNIFDPFIPVVRDLGSQLFLKLMKSQEKILLEFIQSQKFCHCLNDLANEDSKTAIGDQLAEEFRKVMKQCLVHLNFLKNAFTDVLPTKVYDKAVGTLVNSLFVELINKIQMQNDISSLGAVRLSLEMEFLLNEMQIFLKSENPMRLVPKWSKLSELNFILKANLIEIVNRWSDGKGILAAMFTAQEVKQLMRALFQNTERRAQALNRITSN